MKKIILSVVAVFAFGYANAQDVPAGNGFSKGDKFVEGSFSFRSGDVEDSWALTPKMGYMLDNKWAVGGFLALGGSRQWKQKIRNFRNWCFRSLLFLVFRRK